MEKVHGRAKHVSLSDSFNVKDFLISKPQKTEPEVETKKKAKKRKEKGKTK